MKISAQKKRLTRTAIFGALILSRAYGQSTCVNFPAGFIPFSSISYVTAANFAGDHLVVGVPAPGALSLINATIPIPAFTNQMFCDAQVQLAPQQFYPNVYVPTAAELSGNFSAFAGLFVNAANGQPYPNGQIPAGQLANVFAWRIGPAQVSSATQGWSRTGSMTEARVFQTAVLLPSGKVLVAGPDNTAEIYDPAVGTFQSAGQMAFAHGTTVTSTLLGNGQVLIVGGMSAPSSAELYDPVSGKFAVTGSPVQPHGYGLSATLLNDGRVLVVGGLSAAGHGTATTSNTGAEVYDPTTAAFTKTGAMAVNRDFHTATLLADGSVLIAGGSADADYQSPSNIEFDSAEVYDPSSGTFSSTNPMQQALSTQFADLLADGTVLVGGGNGVASAEIFNPVTKSFGFVGGMSVQREKATANLLSSGQVLVEGGFTNFPLATNTADLYNPATATFTATGTMGASRGFAASALLLDGRVLVTGGQLNNQPFSSAELYTPVTEGLVTSQTSLTFRVAAGNNTVPTQTVAVLSNTATIPWTLSTHTYQGGSWLSVTPTSGSSVPGATPVTLTITANPSGLATQDYYGAVILTPTDGIHPPVTIAIVLHIVPSGTAAPPLVTPSGLLFLGTPGATLKPQAFTISNLTSTPLAVNAVASTSPSWFTFAPASATIAAAQTTSITVTATLGSMTAGVYPASIKLLFGDGSSQTVALPLVISATAGSARAGMPEPSAISTFAVTTQLLPRAPRRNCCRSSRRSGRASTLPPPGRLPSSSKLSTTAATPSTPDR